MFRRICAGSIAGSLVVLGITGGIIGITGGVAGAAKLSKSPIKIINISQITDPTQGQPTPEAGVGVQAAAKYINAHGGINGHPLEVTVCNDQDNPDDASNCARQAVSEGVVAAVGDNSEWGTEIVPILQSAGIASIGSLPVSVPDFSSSNSFPLQPGGPGSISVCGYLLAKLGATTIDMARVDNPAAATINLFANLGLTADGKSFTIRNNVPVPPTAVDMSTYVSDIAGSNGLIIAMEANQGERFVRALAQSGYKGKICSSSGLLDGTDALQKIGTAGDGMYIVNEFRAQVAGGPGWANILSGFKKYAPSGTTIDDYSVNSWVSVLAFANVAKTLSSVTAASVLTGFTNAKGVSTQGMIPPYTTTKLVLPAPFGSALSQLFNPAAMITVIKNGKEALTKQFGTKFLRAIPTPALLSGS